MTLGLPFRELLFTFGKCLHNRRNEYSVEMVMAKEDFNPTMKQSMEEYRKAYPELSDSQIEMYFTNIMAILDTIAKNNEAIAKSIAP